MDSKVADYIELSLQREFLSKQIQDGTYTDETLKEYTEVCREMAALYDQLELERA